LWDNAHITSVTGEQGVRDEPFKMGISLKRKIFGNLWDIVSVQLQEIIIFTFTGFTYLKP